MNAGASRLSEFDQKLIQEASWLRPLLDNNLLPVAQEKIRSLIGNLEEELDEDDLCPEETNLKLNVKTWVYMKMDENDRALLINRCVMKTSDIKQENRGHHEDLIALLLGASLCWKLGREMEAQQFYELIKNLMSSPSKNEKEAKSKAGLAYVYSRLSDPRHLLESVELFEEAINVCPDQMYWKLRLGLGYRRLTHINVFTGLSRLNLMASNQLKDYFLRSYRILTEVTERSLENPLFVGPAYTELAHVCRCAKCALSIEDFVTIFGRRNAQVIISDYIKKALDTGRTSPWVLTRCAKLVKNYNIDRAIEMLQTSLNIREHTTTFSFLGDCFITKSERCGKGSDKEHEYLTQVKRNFKKAASFSHNTNLTALFKLGQLYMSLRRIDKAVRYFNRICQSENTGHLLTVVKAFQQAALCYVELGKDELAIDKLTKSIKLAVTCHHMEGRQDLIRKSFEELHETLKNKCIYLFKNPTVCRVFQLAEHLEETRQVSFGIFGDDGNMLDGNNIKGNLNSYLEQEELEKALAALTLLGIQQNVVSSELLSSDEMMNLRRKVLLAAAKFRLKEKVSDCHFVFRELFQLYQTRRSHNVPAVAASESKTKDVLLVCDHFVERDQQPSRTSSTVIEFLLHIFRVVFGLEVTESVQSSNTRTMQEHSMVIVLLPDEHRSDRFEAVLREIAVTENQPLVLTQADLLTEDIPESLRASRKFSCPSPADMRSLIQRLRSDRGKLNEEQIDWLMALFCFLIE